MAAALALTSTLGSCPCPHRLRDAAADACTVSQFRGRLTVSPVVATVELVIKDVFPPEPGLSELRAPLLRLLLHQFGPAVPGCNGCLFESLTACSSLYFEGGGETHGFDAAAIFHGPF